MKIGLLGWIGRGNAGDDAMAAAFVEIIRERVPTSTFVAFADRAYLGAELDRREVAGLPLFNVATRLPIFRSLIAERYFARRFVGSAGLDALIIGGGSILRHEKVIRRYLRIVERVRAANPDARIGAASVSVGPFTSAGAERRCREFLAAIDFALVRDRRSFDLTHQLAPKLDIRCYPDVALAFATASLADRGDNRSVPQEGKSVIGICLRANEDTDAQARIVDWLAHLEPERYRLAFVAMSNNARFDDDAFARQLRDRVDHLHPEFHAYDGDVRRTLNHLARCDAVVAVRLHALIFSAALAKPVLFHAYHEKLLDFADDMGLNGIFEVPSDMASIKPGDFFDRLGGPDHGTLEAALGQSKEGARALAESVIGPEEQGVAHKRQRHGLLDMGSPR